MSAVADKTDFTVSPLTEGQSALLNSDVAQEQARWFCRVRWAAVCAHALVFVVANWVLSLTLSPVPVVGIEIVLILSNVTLYYLVPRIRTTAPLGLVLLLDVVLLTLLLASYGGHMNPFSMVYLVQVILAAVFIGHLWTWVIAAASTIGFSSLFFLGDAGALHQHHSSGAFDLHLQGMLVAFVLISFLVAGFVSRMRLAIDLQERELLGRRSNEERLAALTQLAAGAAHELGTPLGTMSIVLAELCSSASLPLEAEMRDDLACLQQQLKRCEQIVRKMAPESGDLAGEMPTRPSIEDLLERVRQIVPLESLPRLTINIKSKPDDLYLPAEAVAQAVAILVKNGFDASPAECPVTVEVAAKEDAILFTIKDSGTGMDAPTLKRVGEPFFTTKEPGKGTGLGVFLCRLLVSRLSGTLSFDSRKGMGTLVHLQLPRQVRWGD